VALVEFALLLPFVALLVFGTIDLGRGFSQQNRLKNASREGASWAQLHPTRVSGCPVGSSPTIEQVVNGEDAGLAGMTVSVRTLAGASITGCETFGTLPAGTTLVVEVSDQFDVLAPFIGIVTGDPITQRANTKIEVQS
jgi:Flp pilus assembly protein TadG